MNNLVLMRGCLSGGALLGFLGVAMGAFGGHALKTKLGSDMLVIYQIGVQYHLIHALALVLVAALAPHVQQHTGMFAFAGWMFGVGTLLFSGSLYLLAITGVKALGMVTPFGGTMFLLGWVSLVWGAWRGLV